METDDPAKATAIAESVAQPGVKQNQTPVVEGIRRGRLRGERTTMPDGRILIIWQEAPSPTVGIHNVKGVYEARFSGPLHTGGPRSH